MLKKLSLLLVICQLIACNSAQSVIRTTKSAAEKNKTITQTKKPNQKPIPAKNQSTETIESTSKTTVANEVVSVYVLQYKDVAMQNMTQFGIPASIILAQAILESGAGRGDLAQTANNHFGIKCHKDWTGETVNHNDDSPDECFRKYQNPAESFKDHAAFLTNRSRYSELFLLPKGDYQSWATGLKTAGYATDPKYPEKLISYIERYNLHQYDCQVLGTNFEPIKTSEKPAVQAIDDTQYEVQKGDTFYSISKKFNLTIETLKSLNNLQDDTLSIGQIIKIK